MYYQKFKLALNTNMSYMSVAAFHRQCRTQLTTWCSCGTRTCHWRWTRSSCRSWTWSPTSRGTARTSTPQVSTRLVSYQAVSQQTQLQHMYEPWGTILWKFWRGCVYDCVSCLSDVHRIATITYVKFMLDIVLFNFLFVRFCIAFQRYQGEPTKDSVRNIFILL